MDARREQMKPFRKRPVAHRGLFNNKGNAPENSLAAFALAADAGYGIEMDVQLTKDGQLVAAHDGDLKRVAGIDRKICEMTYEEIRRCPLFHSAQTVPLFEEVLALVDGKVPLIIEVKGEGDYIHTCRVLASYLDHYHGVFCVESFHPLAVYWFRRNRPQIIRGQLSEDYNAEKENASWIANEFMTRMCLNWLTKPDFIAYHHKYHSLPWIKRNRDAGKREMVAWTIKNQAEYDEAKKYFNVIIFDSFIPKEDV